MRAYHGSAVLQFDSATTGNAGSGVNVTVRINSTQALATIYDLDDVVIANPLTTDVKGNYAFKSLDDVYDIILNEGTGDESKLEKVNIVDYLTASERVIPFSTLAEAVAETDIQLIFDGAVLDLKERSTGNGGGATWDVVLASGVTTNTFNIVQCVGVGSLALVLRVKALYNARQFGAVSDFNGTTGTDSTGAIQACINAVSGQGTVVVDGDFMYSSPLTTKANTIYRIMGGGLLAQDVNAGAGTAADTFNLTNSNVWIDNVRFKSNDRAVVGGFTVINIVSGSKYKVTNCEFDANASADVGIQPSVTDVEVSRNFFKPKTNISAFAITLNGVQKGIIDSNNIKECDAGIVLLGGSKFITISNNLIQDCHEIGIDLIEVEDITLNSNITSSTKLSGLRIGLTPVAGFPLALSKRVTATGEIYNDCGLSGAGAIEINSNNSMESGGHKMIAPVVRCPSGLTVSAIGCTAPNCEVISPTISGTHVVGVNVQDRAVNFKLIGGNIKDSTDTGVKLKLLAGSPVNGDPRVAVIGVTIEDIGTAAAGIGMTLDQVGNSKICDNTIIFGINTKWGFRFSGGVDGLSMSNNSVIGTATKGDAYSVTSLSTLDVVQFDGNKMGVVQIDTVSGVATIPDGSVYVNVPINTLTGPLVTLAARANQFVWVGAISSTNISLNRVGTSGALGVHYQGKLKQS